MEKTSYGSADAQESKTPFCFENGRVDYSAELLKSSANSANAALICQKSKIILRQTLYQVILLRQAKMQFYKSWNTAVQKYRG